MFAASVQTLFAVLAVSCLSFIGVVFFFFKEKTMQCLLLFLVSFSAGALLGDVFLHMIPEMSEAGILPDSLTKILLGILLSFVIEKIVHWRHCHILPNEHHYHPVGTMSLIGDGMHNFLDGVLIAGSFLIDPTIGIATTIAVALHEIPQEIGEFALLVYSGYGRGKALLWNFVSACTSILGAVLILVTSSSIPNLEAWILPLAAGNFIYIAGADLIPELHKETRVGHAAVQLLCLIAGIGVMWGLTLFE